MKKNENQQTHDWYLEGTIWHLSGILRGHKKNENKKTQNCGREPRTLGHVSFETVSIFVGHWVEGRAENIQLINITLQEIGFSIKKRNSK
jgi:hypothetical protein